MADQGVQASSGAYGAIIHGNVDDFGAEAQAMAVSPAILAILASVLRMALAFVMPANREGLKARLTILCQNLTLIGVPASVADYVAALVANDAVIDLIWNVIKADNVTPISAQEITGTKLAQLLAYHNI